MVQLKLKTLNYHYMNKTSKYEKFQGGSKDSKKASFKEGLNFVTTNLHSSKVSKEILGTAKNARVLCI